LIPLSTDQNLPNPITEGIKSGKILVEILSNLKKSQLSERILNVVLGYFTCLYKWDKSVATEGN
jgi:hypothetical protein